MSGRMFGRAAYENFLLDNDIVGFFDPPIILKSGRPGHWYVNMRNALGNLQLKRYLASHVYAFCHDLGLRPDQFLGIPDGATSLGEEVNNHIDYKDSSEIPACVLRSGKKNHGDPQDRYSVGSLKPVSRVVLIEDVTTTGGSSMEYILRLQEIGVMIDGLVSCVSRHERRDHGRTVRDVLLRDYKIPIYEALTDATTLLPQAVLRFDPPQQLRDDIEAYYKRYGVTPIELPKAT